MRIAVDFDGTIVANAFPEIGKEKPFAVDALRMLALQGHRLILWTSRSGSSLDEAVRWCDDRGLRFYAVNSNYPKSDYSPDKPSGSPKVVADIYLDDRNFGGLPDWGQIYETLSGHAEGLRHKRSRGRFRLYKHR